VRQSAARKDAVRRRLVSAGLVGLLLAAVALYVVIDRRNDAELREALTSGQLHGRHRERPDPPQGQNHVHSPSYASTRPAGAPPGSDQGRGLLREPPSRATGCWCTRSSTATSSPGTSRATAEQKKKLEQFETEHEGDVIVAERANLSVPFAATAWGHRLLCEQVEEAPLERFFDEHVGNGPEDVGRG
jgi:hypothetical protein